MTNTFFTSDTHFSHANICKFTTGEDKDPLRPWDDVEEMDEALIANWNSVVGPNDKIYHCGDVAMSLVGLRVLSRLNGKKRLVRGNHDQCSTKDYLKFFDEIYGVRVLDKMILSHIPLHPDSITKRYNVNVHGHLHGNEVPDGRYISVCVEKTNYTPVTHEQIMEMVRVKRDMYPIQPLPKI